MYRLLRPLLFGLDAEDAHTWMLRLSTLATPLLPLVAALWAPRSLALRGSVFGLSLRSPIGLAAGMDKNARHLRLFSALGFGFLEVGSVTAGPSAGNPRPRAFRLPRDSAIINRMGLPNEGAEAVARRLSKRRRRLVPIGVNLAKTPGAADGIFDFCQSYERLAHVADYVALNLSCPNTTDGQTFAEPAALAKLLLALQPLRARVPRPLLLKLPPPTAREVEAPSAALAEICALAQRHGIAGFIATNTTMERPALNTTAAGLNAIGAGGLSGAPLFPRAILQVRRLYQLTGGQIPIIGVGGVASAEGAYAMIRAGASLVQLYTGLVYEGPGLIAQIHRGLVHVLKRDGFTSIAQAIGRG
jgi:dihydroorotate dehydrogenase